MKYSSQHVPFIRSASRLDHYARRISILVFAIALFGPAASAQQTMDDMAVPTFRSKVNLVSLLFRVRDQHGTFVPNLTKDDFDILDDGEVQNIKFFSSTTDLPMNIALLMDTSRSQSNVLPMEKEIGGRFLEEVLQPADSAFLVDVNLDAEVVQEATSSAAAMQNALNALNINEPDCAGVPGMHGPAYSSPDCRGGTVLYDAIYLAAAEKLQKAEGRKVMVILSDGQDEGSKVKIRQAIEAAQKADTVVYVLLVTDFDFYSWYGYNGDVEMKKICRETGGRMIVIGNDRAKLSDAFKQIAAEMRTQYSVGYTPNRVAIEGTFHKIEIRNKQGFRVQTRDGYFGGEGDENTVTSSAQNGAGH